MDLNITSGSAPGLLTLLAIPGIGPHRAERLAAQFHTLREVRDASATHTATHVPARAASALADDSAWARAFQHTHTILQQAHDYSVRVLAPLDTEYPAWLRDIRDRPPILYVKGTLLPNRRYVACIGTRNPSKFGCLATRGITTRLAKDNWSTVSGLAIGVDTLAHEVTLAEHGHTVAVLANGLDAVYPKTNATLARRILAGGGALVSEQPFGTPALPGHLVSRDRLQSGMSAATIVMQTDTVGGSMHTVRFTLLQNRQLFAPVPSGSLANEPQSRGILALTQETGVHLSTALRAHGEYRELLRTRYVRTSPASPITGRHAYPELVRRLDNILATSGHLADDNTTADSKGAFNGCLPF